MENSLLLGSSAVSPISLALPTLACFLSTLRERNEEKTYNGYQVFRVNATTPKGFQVLKKLMIGDNFDFWSRPSLLRSTDLMVCPQQVQNTKNLLDIFGIPFEIINHNIKDTIDAERKKMLVREQSGMSWDTYHRLSTIHSWMESLATTHDFVSVLTIGSSAEGRPLKVFKISTAGNQTEKPSIWIDGGIHAREWISPAVVTHMANELIQNTAQDRSYPLVDQFDWYIHPVVNPDGYEYTHTAERMWRKTRSNSEGFLASFFKCKGTDPNRNFGYMWGGKGTSNNPCSDIYRGSKAASEVEIAAIQNFLLQKKDSLKLFLTLHSYSQMLFLPWGYDKIRTDDYAELMTVATKAAKALESVYGTKFEVGPSPELLYAAAGGSEDFAKGVAGIKYSYCMELRDTGSYGFILPQEQIVPSGVETFAAVKSMAEDIAKIYNIGVKPNNETKVVHD